MILFALFLIQSLLCPLIQGLLLQHRRTAYKNLTLSSNSIVDATPSLLESSSGVRFEAENSSDAWFTEHDEAASCYATEKGYVVG
ncbi:hypothetical protein Hanom_Chr06g00570351 [Helianthus anomalus]